jgi:Peptidase family M50
MTQQSKPEKPKSDWKALMLPLLIGGLVGVGIAKLGIYFGSSLKNSGIAFDVLNAWDLALLPVWFFVVIGIHELGHLAGGMRRGMRFLLLIVGPFQFSQSASGIRFTWVFNLGTFGGLAAALPNPERPLRPQMLSLIAGGPLASLLLAIIAGIVFMAGDGRLAVHALVIGLMSAMIFLATAIPSRAGGFMSDGRQFIELLRDGEIVMARQRMTSLMAQSMSGIRPRDWDADWLQAECQNASGDPVQMVATRQMAFAMAVDGGNTAHANEHADWLAAHYTDYPIGFRQSLCIELGLFALSKGDVNAAKQWQAHSKGGVVDKSRRALFEAELAMADGDTDLARKQAAEAQKFLHKGMDAGLAIITAEHIAELQTRLS